MRIDMQNHGPEDIMRRERHSAEKNKPAGIKMFKDILIYNKAYDK